MKAHFANLLQIVSPKFVIVFFSALIMQGCAFIDLHSHCVESKQTPVTKQDCFMTNINGTCQSYSYHTEYVDTCIRSECDEGYYRATEGGKCVPGSSSVTSNSSEIKALKSDTPYNKSTIDGQEPILRVLEKCKSGKVSSNIDLTASSLIGENVCGDKMQAWLSSLGKSQTTGKPSEPNIIPMGPTYELDFPSRGIGLFFKSDNNILESELIYFDPIKPGVKRYEGKLPLGLSFQHTRKQIETILGRPGSSASIPSVGRQVFYGSKGLIIMYEGEQADNPNALMRYMIFSKKLR